MCDIMITAVFLIYLNILLFWLYINIIKYILFLHNTV